MTRNELWNKVLNGEMSIDEFDRADKNRRIDEWKQEVLNSAKEVKEASKRGENKWVRKVADLQNAEITAMTCDTDAEELKAFVIKAYEV